METDSGNAARLRLTPHVQSFLDGLPATGYAPRAVAYRDGSSTRSFDGSTPSACPSRISATAIALGFVERRSGGVHPKERATLRKFLAHLRTQGVCSPAPISLVTPADEATQQYVAFLRQDRGLAENSIAVYAPCARDFFAYRVAQIGRLALDALDADAVRAFLLSRIANRSTECSRLVSVALRSVLRFLFLRGETPRDLSSAVPMVRTYRESTVPAVLSAEEVQRVLATPDRATVRGRRDAAILLLLARLGLRASEIVLLEVGDLRWRARATPS